MAGFNTLTLEQEG